MAEAGAWHHGGSSTPGVALVQVLVTSTPGTGHLHPLVPIAAALVAAGHDVVWATASESCARVERYGFVAAPAGMSSAERLRLFSERAPDLAALPPRARRRMVFPGLFGEVAGPRMRVDLRDLVDEVRPDLVVHELAELAAAPVAVARGIPHVTVGFGIGSAPDLVEAAAAGAAGLWTAEGVDPSPSAGFYDHLYLHPVPDRLGDPVDAATVRRVRPAHFDGGDASEQPEWVDAFGRDRPGVYVTFGTEMAGLAPWAEVTEALGAAEVDAVVTLGGAVDPAALGPVPDNVRVEAYVPQRHLLGRSTLVVSHAGSGTLLGAAARGLPQLCIPLGADQWDNADALTAAGAGVTLEPDQRDASSIHHAIVRLLLEEQPRRLAALLAEDLAGLPHPGEHVATMEDLALAWGALALLLGLIDLTDGVIARRSVRGGPRGPRAEGVRPRRRQRRYSRRSA